MRKEEKALKAAKLDRAIKEELLGVSSKCRKLEVQLPKYGVQKLSRAKNSFKDNVEAEEELDVDDDGEIEEGGERSGRGT